MTFGEALEALKHGNLVSRNGWNGKKMWLAYVGQDDYAVHDSGDYMPPNFTGKLLPWIGMNTAQGDFVPWLASQTDILAEDWEIVKQ